MTTTIDTKHPAYLDGYNDGLAWDLDGFADLDAVRRERTGWDAATINAIGSTACAKRWGVPSEGEAWETACEAYNAGAYAGACASERTGKPPRA